MATTDLFPDALDWETWTALTLQQKAAAAAPHASPSLIAAALPAIAPLCTCVELVRLTAACRELRAVEQLPIDFSAVGIWSHKPDRPTQFIRFIKQHKRRFLVSKLTTWCLQEEFDWILKSAIGLQKLRCTAANRVLVRDDRLLITSLEAVPQARSLTDLTLDYGALYIGHGGFTDLGPLARCTNLRRFSLLAVCDVKDLSPLAHCIRLTELSLRYLRLLEDLSPLAQLISLRALKVQECASVSDITPLGRLVALEELTLVMLTKVIDIQPLANCTALHYLWMTGCFAIENVRPLAALPSLRSLTLAGCRALTDVSPLARCSSLESLNLSKCDRLRGDLSGLVNECASLRQLNLRSTKARCEPREGLEVII